MFSASLYMYMAWSFLLTAVLAGIRPGDILAREPATQHNYRINYIITRPGLAACQAQEKQIRWVKRTGLVLGMSGWADSVSLWLAHLSSSCEIPVQIRSCEP